MILLALIVGTVFAYTGPAFDEHRAKRRRAKDFPKAKIQFLLPSSLDR